MKIFNVGIVGPGRVANRLVDALNNMDNAQFWSVCGTNDEQVKSFSLKYGAKAPIVNYTEYDQFLNDKLLDVVIISAPDNLHADFAVRAMRAGKHVFIEKPLCTSIEDAKKIIETNKIFPVKATIGYHLRWHVGLRALRELLHSDVVGRIFHMNINWAHTFIEEATWRKDCNLTKWWCCSAVGTHAVDLATWLLVPICGEIQNVKMLTSNANFNTNDENVSISMSFKNGATVSINCSILFNLPLSLDIFTSNGVIHGYSLTGANDQRKITFNDKEIEFNCNNNMYQDELTDLLHAINNDSAAEVSLLDGYNNICCMLGEIPD